MAEETLTQLTVSGFPHQKKSKARRIEKELKRRTKANLRPKNRQLSTEEMYHELVRTLGNG